MAGFHSPGDIKLQFLNGIARLTPFAPFDLPLLHPENALTFYVFGIHVEGIPARKATGAQEIKKPVATHHGLYENNYGRKARCCALTVSPPEPHPQA